MTAGAAQPGAKAAILRSALRLACGPDSGGAPVGEKPAGTGVDATAMEPGISDSLVAALVTILAANKVPLVSVAAACEAGGEPLWAVLAARPDAASALERERGRRARLIASYRTVASELRGAGIDAVLFKSPSWFPYLSSNLDVLVGPSAFGAAAAVIERLGHIRFPHYREDHKLLFRTFEGAEPGLSVHLHEAVSWGRVVILEAEGVVARSVPGEESWLRVACPQDALAVTLAHTILETDQIRLSDVRTVRWCLDRGANVARLLDQAAQARWLTAAASALILYDFVSRIAGGPALLDAPAERIARVALARERWATRWTNRIQKGAQAALPFALPRLFSKEHLLRLILRDDRRDPEKKVVDLAASAWNLLANRAGMRARPASLITISGPDGAGKSRLAEALVATLSLCEVPARRFWSRGGFSSVAVAGKAIARRVAPGAVPGTRDERAKREFLRTGWRRRLWVWAVALEQAISLQRLRVPLALGRTVVCDRYAYDTLADVAARLPRGNGTAFAGRAAAFLLAAAPSPDLAFLIEVPPEVAHARKADGTTVEARRDLAEAYGEAAPAEPFVRLDGHRPFPEMANAAIETALRRCFAAFEGKRA